jgi:hypothetical protein
VALEPTSELVLAIHQLQRAPRRLGRRAGLFHGLERVELHEVQLRPRQVSRRSFGLIEQFSQ